MLFLFTSLLCKEMSFYFEGQTLLEVVYYSWNYQKSTGIQMCSKTAAVLELFNVTDTSATGWGYEILCTKNYLLGDVD